MGRNKQILLLHISAILLLAISAVLATNFGFSREIALLATGGMVLELSTWTMLILTAR